MKKSIHEVAAGVMTEQKLPLTVDQLYHIIQAQCLYEFKAKNPKSVLRSQLRRHCENVMGTKQVSNPLFQVSADGRFHLRG
jgi:hypothetical protein